MLLRSPWAANLGRAIKRRPSGVDPSSAASRATTDRAQTGGRSSTSVQPTLYTVLGVDRSATPAEIGVAYRSRAARLATSKSGDLHRLKELNTAYRVLSDPSARAEYDRSLLSGEMGEARPIPQYQRVSVGLKHPQAKPVKRTSAGGASELVALVGVLLLSAVAGWVLLNSASVDLSPIRSMGQMLGIAPAQRPVAGNESSTRPAPASPLPVQGAAASVAAQMRDSAVSLSTAQPRPESTVDVNVSLRRAGRPASSIDVFATAYAAATGEMVARSETVKTNPQGEASVPLTVPGRPGSELRVEVIALVDGHELPWGLLIAPR